MYVTSSNQTLRLYSVKVTAKPFRSEKDVVFQEFRLIMNEMPNLGPLALCPMKNYTSERRKEMNNSLNTNLIGGCAHMQKKCIII